jgi:hypothetical protein
MHLLFIMCTEILVSRKQIKLCQRLAQDKSMGRPGLEYYLALAESGYVLVREIHTSLQMSELRYQFLHLCW